MLLIGNTLFSHTEPRRAAVALIIRVVPSAATSSLPALSQPPPTLSEFFDLDWVKHPDARPEILFLRRDNPAADSDASLIGNRLRNTKEVHVAFPGGRTEEGDEGGLYTGKFFQTIYPSCAYILLAMRQTWEEIGLDLAERDFTCIGQLDDREITTSLGKRLLMILSPFVFLQLTPHFPPTDPAPSTTLYWTPLASLVFPYPRWSNVAVDAASRIAPRHSTALRLLVRLLVGSMEFPAILLDPQPSPATPTRASQTQGVLEKIFSRQSNAQNPQQLKLWGLSLGMTLDLLSYMVPATSSSTTNTSSESRLESPSLQMPFQMWGERMRMEVVAPSLASVFPRFSYPDVNFWIW
jgi:8-oxo-dGTP pyrophosphatase MutT (NUDIX family)